MWYLILVLSNTPLLGELFIWEIRVINITGARLSKVDHVDIYANLGQFHTLQLGEGSSQTVSSYFDLVSWEKGLESSYLRIDLVPDFIDSSVESSVYFAVTFGPRVIGTLSSV